MRNPYSVLGVKPTAERDEIRKAYRKLAKAWHPDTAVDVAVASARFSEISHAWSIVGDLDKRNAFDRGDIDAAGRSTRGKQSNKKARTAESSARSSQTTDKRTKPRPRRRPFVGRVRDAVAATHAQIAEAATRVFQGPPAPSVTDTFMDLSTPLDIILSGGRVEMEGPNGNVLFVRVPKGAPEGHKIHLPDEGDRTPDGELGDLFLTVRHQRKSRLWSEDTDIHAQCGLTIEEAVLGGEKEISVLDGTLSITIPPWSDSDRVLKFEGRGLPGLNGSRGDLFLHLRIVLPNEPDPRLIDLLSTGKNGFHV